jgi:uncharacterized protein (DUF2235 family)
MRRLVVCADGTWNRPGNDDQGVPAPTNVVKIQQAIKAVADDGCSQIVYYHPGVGTGDILDKLVGGALGKGIDRNILECYQFLVNNYHPGDELYFFGFSRGAYTVRSLSGLIRNSGLLRQEYASMAREAFSLYRDRDPAKHPTSDVALHFRKQFTHQHTLSDGTVLDSPPIECIGVWDTVGALGIPVGLFDTFNHHKYGFHDMRLSARVKNAFHALAIDERRKPFAPTLWEQPKADLGTNWLEQAWFSGVHSNVGGGYADSGLSDTAFMWMKNLVDQRTALEFNDAFVGQIAKPNHLGRIYDSLDGPMRALGELTRALDAIRERQEDSSDVNTWEYVHLSAKRRYDDTVARQDRWDPENFAAYRARRAPEPLFLDLLTMQAAGSAGGAAQAD